MMMTISKDFRFEAGHRLVFHRGKCHNVHGHSYKLRVFVQGPVDPKTGMVCDYSNLAASIRPIVEAWDHCYLYNEKHETPALVKGIEAINGKVYPFPGETTAENMAEYLAAKIIQVLPPKLFLKAVVLKETATSSAEWREDGDS